MDALELAQPGRRPRRRQGATRWQVLLGLGGSGPRGTVSAALRATVGRIPVTLSFLGACALVSAWLQSLPAGMREEEVLGASTNLDNLARGDISTLLTSAFVGDGGPAGPVSLLALGVLLASAEILWSSRRLVAVFGAGHVLATLLVAAGLAVGEARGWFPAGWRTVTDVGVSYGTVAVAGALSADWPRVLRPVWVLGWLTGLGAALAHGHTFTDAGHVCALLIGFGIAVCDLRDRRGGGGDRHEPDPAGLRPA